MPTDPISRAPNAPATDLALAIERILGHDADPVFPSSLVLLHAMRDAIADPTALGIAGLTTTAWVLPANEDIASQNDPASCRVCPLTAMLLKLGWIQAYGGTGKHPWREHAENDAFQFALSHGSGNSNSNPWRSFCEALAGVAKVTSDIDAIAALGELLGQLPEPAPLERITVTAELEMLNGGTPPLEEVRASLQGGVVYDADGAPIGTLTDVSVTKTPTYSSERVSSALNRATDDIIEAVDAPATGLRDGLNLLANAAMSYLKGEARDLEEVVAANWDADTTLRDVLSWIEDGT